MHRDRLAADHGMLFSFPAPGDHSFWMKHTRVALDMVFLDADRRVVGTVERAVPFSKVPRSVGAPSCYVLEANAGFVAANGVRKGQVARFGWAAALLNAGKKHGSVKRK
jgi:hypothetical protein